MCQIDILKKELLELFPAEGTIAWHKAPQGNRYSQGTSESIVVIDANKNGFGTIEYNATGACRSPWGGENEKKVISAEQVRGMFVALLVHAIDPTVQAAACAMAKAFEKLLSVHFVVQHANLDLGENRNMLRIDMSGGTGSFELNLNAYRSQFVAPKLAIDIPHYTEDGFLSGGETANGKGVAGNPALNVQGVTGWDTLISTNSWSTSAEGLGEQTYLSDQNWTATVDSLLVGNLVLPKEQCLKYLAEFIGILGNFKLVNIGANVSSGRNVVSVRGVVPDAEGNGGRHWTVNLNLGTSSL